MDIYNRNPHTPRSGNELRRTVDSLNNKFFLDLPNPAYSSPASRLYGTANGQIPLGVRCATLIKYLFFNAGPKLERLILDFEEWAQPRISQWTFKERQEPGTLPTTPTFIRRDVPAGSMGIKPEGRQELLKHLEKLLNDERYLINAGMTSTTDRVINDSSRQSNGRMYDALRGDANSSTYSTGVLFRGSRVNSTGQIHSTNPQQSKGPEANDSRPRPPQMNEAASFPGTNKRKSTEENEVFATAPNSPISATSPTPDELLGDLLDEFEDFDLDDFDLGSVTKADVDVGDQKQKSSKKRQSRIDSFMKASSSKATETMYQVNKSSIGEDEGVSFASMAPPTIFSRNQSNLGTSFNSTTTDATELIEHLDEISSTQSSTGDFWNNEEFRTSFNAVCENAGRTTSSSRTSNQEEDSVIAELAKNGPFSRKKAHLPKIPLRYRYELERIAALWKLPVERLLAGNRVPSGTHAEFWEWVKNHNLRCDNHLPEKSSLRTWNNAVEKYQDTGKNCDAVILSGEFEWCEKSDPGYLKLNLKPMKLERSCRFYRRFGSDRFLAVTIPYASKVPEHLASSSDNLQDSIAKWLVTTDHHCLGRVWRAFYLEEVKVKAAKKEKDKDKDKDKDKEKKVPRMKVHFFAVDGVDFVGTSPRDNEVPPKDQLSEKRTPMSLFALINWHMPFDANIGQTDCKLFQRFSLGLSKTMPSVALRTEEIFRLEDPPDKTVMNDGCARISKSLAIHIADMLDIGGTTPSCFQGRIAGAKGVWMVDRDDTAFRAGDRGFWIQISDSQLKIKPHPAEVDKAEYVDPDKLTFEVVNWSKPLHAVDLNIQLLTILEHRGVQRTYIEGLIREQIKLLYDEFAEIFGAGNRLGCRRLMQKLRPPGDDSARKKTKRIGGWPMDEAEQTIFLLESGFEPLTCQYLADLLKDALKKYLERYVEKLQIRVPLSTYAYCIADPYGVLEEDEVYFGLSQAWDDHAFSDTVFDDMEVLVGRLPAHYPWDIQKRKVVWNKELRHFKDVIVFSSKGNTPLAHILSGGDYDGDTPWICWDPNMVGAFSNVDLQDTPPEDEFGLVRHSVPLREINLRSADEFLFNAFRFNFKPSLLGTCTNELERLSYDKTIDSDAAICLSGLVSHLVDSRKAGIELTEEGWKAIRGRVSPQRRQEPAYKSTDGRPWKESSIVDYLKFKVTEVEKERVLCDFAKLYEEKMEYRKDDDLTRIWMETLDRAEDEKKDGKPDLLHCLKDLRQRIKAVQSDWRRANASEKTTFADDVQAAANAIQAIKPLNSDHPLVITWQNSEYEWDKLRASCLYKHFGNKFPWYSVGETLCKIKAEANSPTRTQIEDIYLASKLDTRRSKRIEARALLEEEDIVDEEVYEDEDVFSSFDYDEI